MQSTQACLHDTDIVRGAPQHNKTMGDMQLFTQDIGGQNVAIKALMVDGGAWFRGTDIAAALGYARPRDAVRNHVDEQDRETLQNLGGGGRQFNAPPRPQRGGSGIHF